MSATAAVSALFEFDLAVCGGARELAGADEVGRGCLAGPIVAAAVVFDYSQVSADQLSPLLAGLGDSKKITAQTREELFPLIVRYASRFTVVSSSSRTIDSDGLNVTNLNVLRRSLEALQPAPPAALVDGHQLLRDCLVPHTAVKKGDSRSACIAAASIIAKVMRDRLMLKLHKRYPEYGFDHHVGYSTLAHRQAIARHGFCPQHRRSFKCELPEIEEDGEADASEVKASG